MQRVKAALDIVHFQFIYRGRPCFAISIIPLQSADSSVSDNFQQLATVFACGAIPLTHLLNVAGGTLYAEAAFFLDEKRPFL